MVYDLGTAVRTELNAALNKLAPAIAGLETLTCAGLSDESLAIVKQVTEDRHRRQNLIRNVLTQLDAALARMDALVADGYPELPIIALPEKLVFELEERRAEMNAALAIFIKAIASMIAVELGSPSLAAKTP